MNQPSKEVIKQLLILIKETSLPVVLEKEKIKKQELQNKIQNANDEQ